MRKFTLFLMSLFLMLGTAMAQNYSLTETGISSEELNAKTAPTLIAIKNLSNTNNYYYVGNTGTAPYSAAEFSDAAVFVWQPVEEGVAGSYYLMKPDGTYMQATSPKDFGTVDNAAVFTTTNPTTTGSESTNFNGDSATEGLIVSEALLVRFVNATGTWINVQNGDTGTPVYNSGLGGWTIHHVYAVEEAAVEPEPEPEPEEPEVVPAADKCYTVVADGHSSGRNPQWAINNEGTAFVSTGNTTVSTDAQKQFAFVAYNEATYIYSVSAKMFVMKDGSLAAKNGDAVEITKLENGKFFFRFDANHNVNIGGSGQMTIDWWATVDGGNQFTLTEVGDFDATEALTALKSTVEIVYVYMYNGVEAGRTIVKGEIGNAYPAVVNIPFGFEATAPEGVVESAGEVTVECTLVENYPIKYASTVEEINTWYYMQMHSNQKKFIQYIAEQSYIEWADAEVAADEEDSYTWAFVGDPANGFKLVNKAAGTEFAVCSDGSSDPILGAFADAVAWKPAYSKETADAGYFCLQYPGGDYMNAQSGKVAYWYDNDAGSTFLLTEREITVEPEPEVQPTSATFDFTAPSTLNPAVTPSETPSTGIEWDDVTFTNNNVTVNINKGTASSPVRVWTKTNLSTEMRTYNGSTITITAPVGTKLTGIVFEGGKVSTMTADGFESGTWAGNAQSVEFAVTNTLNVTAINVTLVIDNTPSVSAPVASVESGVYTTAQSVTFTSEYANIENPTISYYYTTDGSEPTSESTMVEGAIEVTENCTINIVAVITVDGEEYTSEVATYEYIISANLRYVAVTAAEQVVAGKALIVANNLAAFSNTEKAYGYLPGREVTVTDGAIKEPVYYGFEFEAAEGGWYIKDHNGKYLYQSGSYNNFNMSETVPAEGGIWTVAIAEDGTATITNAATGKYMQYSTTHSSYGAYAEAQDGGVVPTLYMPATFAPVAVTPAEAVTSLREITIEFSDDIAVKKLTDTDRISIDYGWNVLIYTTATAEGNILKLYADTEITDPGKYPLAIPAGVVTRAADGAEYAGGTFEFEVIKAAAPFTVTKVTPSESVEALSEISIEFSDAVNVPMTASGKFTITDAAGNTVAEFAAWEVNVNSNVVTLTLATPIETVGEYTLTIPEGLVSRQSDSVTLSYTCTFTVAEPVVNPLTVVKVTPEEAVAELSEITIEFSDEVAINGTSMSWATLKNADASVSLMIMAWDLVAKGNVVKLPLSEVVTTPGEYTLNIPTTIISRKSDGAEYTGTFTFTVEETAAPFTAVKVTPEEAVAELSEITIEFSDEVAINGTSMNWATLKNADASVSLMIMAWDLVAEGNVVKLPLSEVVTTPGEYTLNIPTTIISRKSDGAEYTGTFTFTVTVADGIDGINGEAGNSVIYDLTGRKVEKITEGGIYIVNGKKVYVK